MTDPLPHQLTPSLMATGDAGDDVQMTCPLDREGTVSKATILQNLATHLSLPAHFGHNWDAAFDSLLDWADEHPACPRLVFVLPSSASVNAQDMETFLAVLRDVNEYLVGRGSLMRLEVFEPGRIEEASRSPPGG